MSFDAKILIVDDFEMMRFQIRKELTTLGWTDVTEAVDGSHATELLLAQSETKPFDVIFCDWNMPKVSGLEVLQFCRAMPTYQNTPFVMVTAEAENESVVKAIKAGANDYIVKPITSEALQIRLRSIFARLLRRKAA